jgi:hypothetical protein
MRGLERVRSESPRRISVRVRQTGSPRRWPVRRRGRRGRGGDLLCGCLNGCGEVRIGQPDRVAPAFEDQVLAIPRGVRHSRRSPPLAPWIIQARPRCEAAPRRSRARGAWGSDSPTAIDRAPATRPAVPAAITACPDAPDPATPSIRLEADRIPSSAPRTAARNQLDR